MRYRSGVLALATLVALAAAPPLAAAAPGVRASADSLHRTSVAVPSAPESVHVFLLTQLEVTDSLGGDPEQLHAHVQRAIDALMTGLTVARIPVYAGTVFVRDATAPRVSARPQCSTTMPRAFAPLNRASWTAQAATARPSLVLLARR